MTTNEDGVATTVTEQLRQAEVESAICTDEMQQAKNAIRHIEPAYKIKAKQLAETENFFQKENAEMQVSNFD